MKTQILCCAAVLILFFTQACVYEDPFESSSTTNIAHSKTLLSWDSTDDLVISAAAETPPSGESIVYSVGFSNLIGGGTFENNYTGFIESFTVSSSSAINSDSQMTGTRYLALKVSRDSGDDYYYHTFDVTSDNRNYKFKYDYKHVSLENIQVTLGDTTNDKVWEIDSVIAGSGTAIHTFSIDTSTVTPPGTPKQIRFGYINDNSLENSFEVYLDNIALFENNGHRVYTTQSIGDSGVYQLIFQAKALTSDTITLELGTETKSWSLSSSGWTEVQVQAQLYVSDGAAYMAIIPTSTVSSLEFPGYVYITEPKLYLLAGQAVPEN